MSLEACPVCGHAVSTTNARCHHCSVSPRTIFRPGGLKAIRLMHVVLFCIVAAMAIAIWATIH
jgi:hypothetical protein